MIFGSMCCDFFFRRHGRDFVSDSSVSLRFKISLFTFVLTCFKGGLIFRAVVDLNVSSSISAIFELFVVFGDFIVTSVFLSYVLLIFAYAFSSM